MTMIRLKKLTKIYRSGKLDFPALKGIDLVIEPGEMVAIMGPSGSGKTTILNMITGIDKPTKGEVHVDGKRIDVLGEDPMARFRGDHIGIVFQFFQLFPTLNALDNAMIPMDFARKGSVAERKKIAKRNLELVGLGDKLKNLPTELSGGEQQRVAIARALANDPKIVVGDEPTGNLDTMNTDKMFEILRKLNDNGKTVVYVTHNADLAKKADRTIKILDGKIV